jgi:hypothetical protein
MKVLENTTVEGESPVVENTYPALDSVPKLESDRSFGRLGTTDFRGDKSLEDGRGVAWLGSATPFELTSCRLGALRGCIRAAEGETFEGQIPGALPSETWRGGFGGS